MRLVAGAVAGSIGSREWAVAVGRSWGRGVTEAVAVLDKADWSDVAAL